MKENYDAERTPRCDSFNLFDCGSIAACLQYAMGINMNNRDILWYRQPAKKWIEALPLGNGRIGAMVYGGGLSERIQIDESTFWSGEPSSENNRPGTKELLGQIRQVLLNKDYEKADHLGRNLTGNKNNYGTNMPVGELELDLCMEGDECKASDLRRSLDISAGIANTEFTIYNNPFVREVFVSGPHQIVLMKFYSWQKVKFQIKIRYDGIGNNTGITGIEDEDYLINGDALEDLHSDGKCGVHLNGRIRDLTDGKSRYESGCIVIDQATAIELRMGLATNMFMDDADHMVKEQLNAVQSQTYEELKEIHIRDVKDRYRRMDIRLEGGKETAVAERKTAGMAEPDTAAPWNLPTDERIERAAAGASDPDLYALMFQYGRYLLIASSREDAPLPTHMGGIWNDNIYNRIDCTQDMHIDMNIQMQYWLAGACNLTEAYWPLFHWLEQTLVPSGKKTAREAYGAKGWTAHVTSNPWGFTSLGWSYNWGVFSFGGAWTAVLLWDYYEFTKDRAFLKDFAYPILEGAAQFAVDYLFFDEVTGWYMTGPSYSPENQFSIDGKNYFLSLSTTCDVVLVREILEIARKVSKELECADLELVERIDQILPKLPPYQIGKKGQIQEWMEDFEEPIPNHRHTTHLLGLYPFHQIDARADQDLKHAAQKTLELRYENFEITSWGMAMLVGYHARMNDGEQAWKILNDTVKRLVKPNLASVMSDETSMWCGTWELDGNTGITAGIGEMLLQSFEDQVVVLPALPADWKHGHLKGSRIRGGHTADVEWENGKLISFQIMGACSDKKRIRYGEKEMEVQLQEGIWAILDQLKD
ncbi:MAG: hypothetical protein RHS_2325 [Robinsoniella sp. RHS]|uniref:glycoside hydrolase family 95 protein n=1 Tax=Robinsoniella sp. RHS TaxID=1504536 RepID=UPI000658E91A|nr:MAG: hypothetical protein RHS_2325 [Robinsoniella sp. RHS]